MAADERGGSGPAAVALQATNDLRRIVLDDGSNVQNPAAIRYPEAAGLGNANTLRTDDTVTGLTGVMDQRFGKYRIQPTGPVNFMRVNNRPAAPAAVGGTLKVASFNLLNYFSTVDTTASDSSRLVRSQRHHGLPRRRLGGRVHAGSATRRSAPSPR